MRAVAMIHALTRAATAATMLMVPGDTRAQRVRLEVRPRLGDTLRITLEHSVTVSGAARAGFAAIPPSTSAFRVTTREIVLRTTGEHASLVAIVDSATSSPAAAGAPSLFSDADRTLQGARVKMEVAPDGASTVAEEASTLDPAYRALIGEMPGVLPPGEVAVGATWIRDLPLPVDGSSSGGSAVRATFRLDSLTASGTLAWISLKGAVTPAPPADSMAHGSGPKGTLTGSMVLDRRRGWLLESNTTVNIESVVAMSNGAEPLVVKVRVVQSMRTKSARP